MPDSNPVVFIGVDVGTGSARAGVFDPRGNMLGSAKQDIEIYREPGDIGVRTRAVRNRTLRTNGMRTYAAFLSLAGRRSDRNPFGI